jgi:hypothetical protein
MWYSIHPVSADASFTATSLKHSLSIAAQGGGRFFLYRAEHASEVVGQPKDSHTILE